MSDRQGFTRGFHHIGAAWYGEATLPLGKEEDVVHIGLYAPDGGTTGEFKIAWERQLDNQLVPRLKAYDDAWRLLSECGDLLSLLASFDNQNVDAATLCQHLVHLGFEDKTCRHKVA